MQKFCYIALLRGINVGGKNRIKMADLTVCFMKMGFDQVTTYIQSGNVLFLSEENDKDKLTSLIEKTLSDTFDYQSKIVLLSDLQLEEVIKTAPPSFGKDTDTYKFDVLFIKPPLTSQQAIDRIQLKEGVDQVAEGKHVVYMSRLKAQASQSSLIKLSANPVYQQITVRNWNTTTKLWELAQKIPEK